VPPGEPALDERARDEPARDAAEAARSSALGCGVASFGAPGAPEASAGT